MIKEVGPLDARFESYYSASEQDSPLEDEEYIGFYRPAETIEHAGEDYLYQTVELTTSQEIPAIKTGSSVEQYVDELNMVYEEHQEGFRSLIDFGLFPVEVEIHGQTVEPYEGETWTKARPVPRTEMNNLMNELKQETGINSFTYNPVLHPSIPPHLATWDLITEDKVIHLLPDGEEFTYLDDPME